MNNVINYVWLGGSNKTDLVNICISSWRKEYPDYKLIEWNENNLYRLEKIKKNRFFNECVKRELWAYASDYARLAVLYEFGGIYFDTDIQVLKPYYPKDKSKLVLGFEDEKCINGAVIFSPPKNPVIEKILSYYDLRIWRENIFTIPAIMTLVISELFGSQVKANQNQEFQHLILLDSTSFYPYHYNEIYNYDHIPDKAYTIHWWGKSWHTNDKRLDFLRYKHVTGLRKILIKFLQITGLLRIFRGGRLSSDLKIILRI